MSKFVIPLLLQLLLVGAVPHAKKHIKYSDSGSNWDADKSGLESTNVVESSLQEGNATSAKSSGASNEDAYVDDDSPLKKKACSLELIWYYAFPFLVYFLLIVLAVLLALGVINLCLCLRRGCPLMPCDVTLCHRTTVTEEKNADCRRKDKLQLSLVNVNKHYYRLDGQDVP